MKISELKEKQGNVEIEAEIKSLGEVREFNKFGKTGRVANVVISDDSGDIKLTLWSDDIDNAKVGGKVKITNGFVNVFQGEKQLTAGKFGKVEFVAESEKPVKASKKAKE